MGDVGRRVMVRIAKGMLVSCFIIAVILVVVSPGTGPVFVHYSHAQYGDEVLILRTNIEETPRGSIEGYIEVPFKKQVSGDASRRVASEIRDLLSLEVTDGDVFAWGNPQEEWSSLDANTLFSGPPHTLTVHFAIVPPEK